MIIYRSARDYSGSNLQPTPIEDGLSPASAHLLSPMSDMVGPSPVTSNGTTTTDIEDEVADEAMNHEDIPRAESQVTVGTPPMLQMGIRSSLMP